MGYRTHISNQSLPAAGAYYTSATKFSIEPNLSAHDDATINLLAKYALDDSTTGRCRFRVVWYLLGPDGTEVEAHETIEDHTITASTETREATVRVFRRVRDLYASEDGEWTLIELPVRRHAVGFRVEPAEVGDTANPGIVWFYVEGL